MRRTPLALLLVPLFALIGPLPPAVATTTVVTVDDMRFAPAAVTVAQGNSVTWRFRERHTSTSNQGFWNSGTRSSGDYVVTFRDAGTFGYFCTLHPMMKGTVRVPVRFTGRPAAGYTVRWSSRTSTPANRRYDVQFKRTNSSTWQNLRINSATRSATFNPSASGGYHLRARTRNVGVGISGWSSTVTLTVS